MTVGAAAAGIVPAADPAVADAVIQRVVDDEGVPHGTARRWFEEMLGFLALLRRLRRDEGQAVRLVPSQGVDAAWHAFILHTRAYTEYCEANHGFYVHHTPSPPGDRDAQLADTFDYLFTRVQMRKLYGTLDEAVWPNDL